MASLSKDGKITFYVDKKKRSFRVTRLNKKAAQTVLNKVEQLLSYRVGNEPLPESLQRWLSSCDRWLIEAMANAGLCDPPNDVTVVEFFEKYIQDRPESRRDWQKNHNNTLQAVKRYFGSDVLLRDVSSEDAQQFRRWLATEAKPTGKDMPKQGYAEATVAGHIKICRKIFKHAEKQQIVHANPFKTVEAGSQKNSDRQFEIDRDMLQRLLDVAPDRHWRLLILLVRIGGLRTGSETRALRWRDVDFVNREINVPGAKGKNRPDGSRNIRWRIIPIYPELLEPLKDCFDPTEEFVLYGITGTDANVYNKFRKLVKKAGLTPWPRLWHNMRASRDSELTAAGIPDFIVSQLQGNTVQVSRDHYKMVLKGTLGQPEG
jgi:integrase